MPLYEYRCRGCGNQFEVLQRLGEGAEGLACTSCGAAALDKQFSTFATGGGASESTSGCDAPDCGAGAGAGACRGGGACSWDSLN
jgi:putative FmdB family regulatory protein